MNVIAHWPDCHHRNEPSPGTAYRALALLSTLCLSHAVHPPMGQEAAGASPPASRPAATQPAVDEPPRLDPSRPFTEGVPNSTAKFVMLPVPGRRAWIGQTEVTWDAYDVFLLRRDLPEAQRTSAQADPGPDAVTRPTPPYSAPDRGWGHEGFPAVGITHHAAEQYCRWLSEKTGRTYRLPTVAEWQLACRAGRADGSGTDATPLQERAWFRDNADEKTHHVASKRPNAVGLYDVLGNVAEWCTDADGGPVVCGGSFRTAREDLSCNLRERQSPGWNASDPSFPRSKWWLSDGPFVGFRVVCEGEGGCTTKDTKDAEDTEGTEGKK